MKFKTKNRIFLWITVIELFFFTNISPAFAIYSNRLKQSISIESDTQSINMLGNVVIVFAGNVVITQGMMKVNADKAIISRFNGEKGKEIIDSYGNPAVLYQIQQDKKKTITGRALKIQYDLAKKIIILSGDACLEQFNNKVFGDEIIYLIKDKAIQIHSKKGKKVTAVLLPTTIEKIIRNKF